MVFRNYITIKRYVMHSQFIHISFALETHLMHLHYPKLIHFTTQQIQENLVACIITFIVINF